MSRLPPIFAFAAPSGTGKTTLLEGVIGALVAAGLRVAVLKSDAHRVVLDKPGKDSWRFSEAGARSVAVLSSERLALFARVDGDVSLVHVIDRLFPGVDIVLAEGFRRSGLPTIRVHRSDGPSDVGWEPPQNVVAWASDTAVDTVLPVLPLGDPSAVARWILDRVAEPVSQRRVTVVCPVGAYDDARVAAAAARRFGAALGAEAVIVGERTGEVDGVRAVADLRPGLGLLGAVFTGLATADTPEILVVGARHHGAPDALLRGLVAAGPRRADLVYPRVDGHAEPALALYGHRCLSSIQAALLSGELKLTGWWGQVRSYAVEAEVWGAWDPDRRAFPSPARP